MKNILALFIATVFSLITICLQAQTDASDNTISQSITYHEVPAGPTVYGIFEGRPPCREIARQVDTPVSAECTKVKWRLILYRDPVTKQPTSYSVLGRLLPPGGKWSVIKGIPSNANAEVYKLELARPGTYFYLLKGDDNVLFILDEHKTLRVGNEDFSYTLNRVKLVINKKE